MAAPLMPTLTHDRRPRVLHLITDLRVGGAEVQLATLVERQQADGAPFELVGVACLRGGGAIADRIERAGVRVWRLGASGPFSFSAALVMLARLLRRERVSIGFGWLYHAAIALAAPGVAPSGCRVVWNIRGMMPARADKLGTRAAVRVAAALVGRADHIVYNSPRARGEHEMRGFSGPRSSVIPNGYRARMVPPPSDHSGPLRLLFAARVHPQKDVGTFLRALRELTNRGIDVRARLVGGGCDRENVGLQALVASTGTAAIVEFGGVRSDMSDEYAAADVVVSSSAWGEGFQNVLAESLIAGVPAVSTDVGEARWILGDDRLVVPPRDPESLAGAVERIARMPRSERRTLALLASTRMREEFGDAVMLARYAQLIDGLRAR
jgi:glycosyltransferase involved in cell wall biosynthesis